jgi:hypothetical protein
MVPRAFAFSDYRLEVVRTMQARDYCGDTTYYALCEKAPLPGPVPGMGDQGGHTFRKITRSCHRVVCETCADKVIAQRARELADRIRATWTEFYKNGIDLRYKDKRTRRRCMVVELILSPPARLYDECDTIDGFKRLYRKAADYARAIGLLGAVSVVHSVRGDHESIEAWMHGEGEKDFSIHYHFIGFLPYGHIVKSDEFNLLTSLADEDTPANRATGWTYRIVPKWDWSQDKQTIYKKLRYELDHACVTARRLIRQSCLGEREVIQHGAVDRLHGVLHSSTIKKIEEWGDELCRCGARVFMHDDEGTKSEEPIQVLKSRRFVLRLGALARAINKYGFVVGIVRHETIEAWATGAD